MIRRLPFVLPSLLAVLFIILVSSISCKQANAVVTLAVTSEYGSPDPAGTTEYEFEDVVNLLVDSAIIVDVNTRIICTGWVGTGSVPASGDTNSLTFTIRVNSTITWIWSYEYTLKIYNPQQVGAPTPEPGVYRFTEGTIVSGSVQNFVSGYVAAGFTGTGSAPEASSRAYFEFEINEPSTLSWLWEETETVNAYYWGDPTTSLSVFGDEKFAQLVVDPTTDVQRVFYYEPVEGNLMYAYFNGTSWVNQVIDSSADVGQFLKVVVSPAGEYHVAYHDATNGYLKYAFSANGYTWTTIQYVDMYNRAGQGLDLRLDGEGDPWISYFAPGLNELRIVERIGETWQSPSVISDEVTDTDFISMSFNEVTLSFVIAYYEGGAEAARYAQFVGDAWVIRDIPAQFESGMYINCNVNEDGQPFFCYQELSQDGRRDLKLIYLSGGQWYYTTLSTTGDSGYRNLVTFNELGFPVVYTYDQKQAQIRQYSWTGAQWLVVNCANEVSPQPFGLVYDKQSEPILYYFKSNAMMQKTLTGEAIDDNQGNVATSGGSGCFIATAAFGALSATEVVRLTSWRDSVLLGSASGSALVNLYYCTSPILANQLHDAPALRTWVIRLLNN